ncbi:MAG: VCBS domain-containing protein [Verrucomicrobiota bacterium]|nr:VCBS domain-containing protein [Verrucomicrobiota bacterium]
MIRLNSDFAYSTIRTFRRGVSVSLFTSVSILSAESLKSSNPFLPPNFGEEEEAPQPVVQSNGPISREIEFRGLFKMNGQYQFSLFNKRDQKSYWLKENEAAAQGISVRNYDSGSRSLTVSINGRTERITLIAAKSSPLPVVASVSPPVNANANAKQPIIPSSLQKTSNGNNNNNVNRAVPRRRVILPKKQSP